MEEDNSITQHPFQSIKIQTGMEQKRISIEKKKNTREP
jgi:hypothetical protein